MLELDRRTLYMMLRADSVVDTKRDRESGPRSSIVLHPEDWDAVAWDLESVLAFPDPCQRYGPGGWTFMGIAVVLDTQMPRGRVVMRRRTGCRGWWVPEYAAAVRARVAQDHPWLRLPSPSTLAFAYAWQKPWVIYIGDLHMTLSDALMRDGDAPERQWALDFAAKELRHMAVQLGVPADVAKDLAVGEPRRYDLDGFLSGSSAWTVRFRVSAVQTHKVFIDEDEPEKWPVPTGG